MANYEYCTRLNDRGHVIKESEMQITPVAEERYTGMFGYDNSIYDHLAIANSVSGFKGNFFCKYVYFDIDSDDLEESHEMAKNFCLLLYNMLNINPKWLFISFSGNKGFHIGIHQNLFGGIEPSKNLPQIIRVLITKILCECFEVTISDIQEAVYKRPDKKKVYNHMDLGIYNDNRLFRIINSLNAKSNLYKIGLTYEELTTLSINQIKDLAKTAKPYRPEVPASALQVIPELKGLLIDSVNFNVDAYNGNFKAEKKSNTGAIFYAPHEGGRNDALFYQAAYLFDKSELYEDHILQIIGLINASSIKPLPESEIKTIVHSAYKRTLKNKVYKEVPLKEIEIYNDWLNEWAEYYSQEPKSFTYLCDKIDQDQESNFSGKLACFIGQGGTRKSYYALNIVAQNIIHHNARAMYSSMEMGKVEFVNRVLDMTFSPENGIPASKICRNNLKSGKDKYLQVLKKAITHIDDRLILSSVSGRTTENYLKDYNKALELYGQIDFLIVDGLSMMGGTGPETERFEKHTKELKGLANATGLNIILICHTTKEAKQWTRDSAPFARGSGKIFDNCDFTISFSNLINDAASTPENIEFMPCLGHLKYYNKRGTGLMLNQIYDFSGVTKKITATNHDPRHFPEYEAFVKQYNKKQRSKEPIELDPF